MRIKKTEVILDDLHFENKTYIADDGKEFHFEHSCNRYEKELAIKHIPLKKVSYMGYECWYYISSIEDFEALKQYILTVVQGGARTDICRNCNKEFINEWVSYKIEYCDDDADACDFISFKQAKKGFEDIQKNFKELEETLNISEI